MELASKEPQSYFKLFGKPTTRPYRRMGVVLTYDRLEKETMDELRARAARIASGITVH
jgi:phosphoribosylglycinamide formyltransferase 2